MDTPTVTLTPLRAEDSAALFGWINDRETVLFNAPYRPVSEAAHRAWFDAIQQRPDAVVVAIRVDDRLIGTCRLHAIHPVHRTAELQIRLGVEADRGHGHGTAALRLLLAFAFRDLNLERVYLFVFATNARAIRAYEKVGFAREGVLRAHAMIDGEPVDVVAMGLMRHEFTA